MGQNKGQQGNQSSEQHGHREGQNPVDIDQDRSIVNKDSHKPGGDGQKKPRVGERDGRKTRPGKGDNPSSPQPGSTGEAE